MRIKTIILLAALTSAMLAQARQQFIDHKSCERAISEMEKRLNAPFASAQAEDSCLYILEQVMNSGVLSETDKILPQFMIETLNKNRVGTQAHDIEFITANGETHKLSEYSTPFKLIYFNDPDCDACRLVKTRLDTTAFIKQLVEQQSLTIIAIYTLNDKNAWEKNSMPQYIVNGWDRSQTIENEELYSLPTLPVFYILDASNTVKVKNEPSLNNIMGYLKKLIQTQSPKSYQEMENRK